MKPRDAINIERISKRFSVLIDIIVLKARTWENEGVLTSQQMRMEIAARSMIR